MKLEKIIIWTVSVLFSCEIASSLNVLAVFPYEGKSHFFVYEPYLQELARRGHNLTVISYFPQQTRTENYHDISLAGKVKGIKDNLPKLNRSYWSIIQIVSFVIAIGTKSCEVLLANKNVQNLWQSKTNFDIVVTELFNNDCSFGLAYKLGAPVVGMTSHMPLSWHYGPLGMTYHPAYTPYMFLEGGTKPNLYQRTERIIFHYLSNQFYKLYCQRVKQNQIQKYFDVPPLQDLTWNVKFVLLYTNFVLNGPNSLPSNVIEVGGYHVAKTKELPEDLKKFIDDSKYGVIYISFGTMFQSASLAKDKLKTIVEAISDLPQRVIWKWDAKELPGNPKDVYLSSWLPQNDILAHPKIVAFYSHCGMLSTTEAMYHGVPMIGMPIFGDQPVNAAAVEESGLGVQIQLAELTKEALLNKINTVLDPEFKKKVKELSRIWHDRPVSAMDSAIYWTEFAARSKNFTFRTPASTVPLYQYLYLDIMMVTLGLSFIVTFVIKSGMSLLKLKSNPKLKKIKSN